MLLQIKVYFIGLLYFLGGMFMLSFPPRNFEQSGTKMRKIRSIGDTLKYSKYIDNEMLLDIIKRIASEDPEMAKVVNLTPLTYGNNSIAAIQLHSDAHSRKPGILIIGALNGMVWGAPNAIIELIENLLYDTNYQTPFFNDYDWYLIPIANPDALNFTKNQRHLRPIDPTIWSRNQTVRGKRRPSYWNKNLDHESDHTCFGTNVNRNFAYHWQGHGCLSSGELFCCFNKVKILIDDVHKTPESCSQFYPGQKPFSTAEAQAIRAYVDDLGDSVQLTIHLHASFIPKKEYILYPWRYTLRQPSNYRSLQAIGEYAARQARLPDGRLYEVHQGSSDTRVAGSFTDYISGVVGTELVFLVKPFHQAFPNITDFTLLETYVKKSVSAILSLVRGWRSSTKQNTLSFFGRDVEF